MNYTTSAYNYLLVVLAEDADPVIGSGGSRFPKSA